MNILTLLLQKPLTLTEGLARKRKDNYLLLRHIAAVLLIYSHSYALAPGAQGEHDAVARVLPGFDGGRIAVLLFFAVSGFLVTSSYLARRNCGTSSGRACCASTRPTSRVLP